MAEIQKMMEQAGDLDASLVLTDCVILTRVESIEGGAGQRGRWHPMGRMDDLRERGLIEQHRDDVCDEDRARR
jgi:hypothetical protein